MSAHRDEHAATERCTCGGTIYTRQSGFADPSRKVLADCLGCRASGMGPTPPTAVAMLHAKVRERRKNERKP